MNAIAREAVRQQKETFEELKRQDRHWFALRLTIGYSAILVLLGVLATCAVILVNAQTYPEFVARAAIAALFMDVVGFPIAVWKFALNTGYQNRLHPVTSSPDAPSTKIENFRTPR